MYEEKELTEKESLALITQMINKARDCYHDTGISSIMWGAVVAFCALERLAEIHFGYRLPVDIYFLTILAIIPQVYFSIREKKARKVKTYDETFLDYLWAGFGICIILLIIATNVIFSAWSPVSDEYRTLTGHAPSFRFYEFLAPLYLMLYGMPTFVTGAAFRFWPMFWGGILCWTCSIITAFTPIKIDLLLTALSAVFAWLIPGIIMERDYRKAKQKLKQTNV